MSLVRIAHFYWFLMDDFEWQKSYSMTFGLISMDRATQRRFPKSSFAFLGGYINSSRV